MWHDAGLDDPHKKVEWVITEGDDYYEVAVVSDLHLGSMYQQVTCLRRFADMCEGRGVTTLLSCGDQVDGILPGMQHTSERFLHADVAFEEYCEEHFPRVGRAYVINGNHEEALAKHSEDGYDFAKRLSLIRKDVKYCRTDEEGLMKKPVKLDGGLRVVMYHGSSCANGNIGQKRELRLQRKVAEMMAAGVDADVYLFGHCHKQCTTSFMGKYIIGLGCFVADSPYQIERGAYGDVSGLLLRYSMAGDGVGGLEAEFVGADKLGGIRRRDL